MLKLVLLIILFTVGFLLSAGKVSARDFTPWWSFQAIDTMKYSRDAAREFLSNPENAQSVIETQISAVAKAGATHVGIATPYDPEFLPILNRWVVTARSYGLNVWFRGNWSGWERWFGYGPITREQHIAMTKAFILDNPDLFEDGDVFTACPECENGGPGDPRIHTDPAGFTRFMIDEYTITKAEFAEIGKDVASNYFSMNGDVARLIMTRDTTAKVDGIVTVDHYVRTPQQTIDDIRGYAAASGGKVVLGEFGIPIPDIQGTMTQEEQAAWLEEFLSLAIHEPSLIGMSYWTGFGGSTEIWSPDGTPRLAVSVLEKYFKPKLLTGTVLTAKGTPIAAQLVTETHTLSTMEDGRFAIPYIQPEGKITVSAAGYTTQTLQFPHSAELALELEVILDPHSTTTTFSLLTWLRTLLSRLMGR